MKPIRPLYHIRLPLVALILLFPVFISAQDGEVPIYQLTDTMQFETFDLPGHVFGNRILSILQDNQGVLWFGSGGGGLHRYDGG